MYHMCADAQEGQKKTLDPLELELKAVVSCHIATVSQTQVICRSSNYASLLNHLPKHLGNGIKLPTSAAFHPCQRSLFLKWMANDTEPHN